jgi:hypothetical protein
MSYKTPGVAIAVLLTCGLAVQPALAADDVVAWNVRVFRVLAATGQVGVVQTRHLAMVHAAIHDAVNAIEPRYERSVFEGQAEPGASPDAAIAAAAHGVLIGTIPDFGTSAQQVAGLAAAAAEYSASLALIPDGPAKERGIAIGEAAASSVVTSRAFDGATSADVPYTLIPGPGYWRPTSNPVPPDPLAGGPGLLPPILPAWGEVTPFALNANEQFRPDGPPDLGSDEYAADYAEVKAIGSRTSVTRTAEQSLIARFWYEGSPVGWNRIARVVVAPRLLDLWSQARLFALLNMAIADGFIAGWNIRYHVNFWRPVTAIRAGDTDGNPATVADPLWETFLNTPAIPDYPSTHSALGGAAAQVLAEFLGTDHVAFTTTSGAPFAGITRSFSSFLQAALENADSRVYAGIHFRSACRDGVKVGRKIGKFTMQHVLKPLD